MAKAEAKYRYLTVRCPGQTGAAKPGEQEAGR
jgi:hypothetical protein